MSSPTANLPEFSVSEIAAALTASESKIYGRFGYGLASRIGAIPSRTSVAASGSVLGPLVS